jgi:hypothetical protein
LQLFGYVRVGNIGHSGQHRFSASLQILRYSQVHLAELSGLHIGDLVTASTSNIING